MIDVYEMLRIKENDIIRVRKEIQALRCVAPLLSESDEPQVLQPSVDLGSASHSLESNPTDNPAHDERSSEPGEILAESGPSTVSRLRSMLGLAAGE